MFSKVFSLPLKHSQPHRKSSGIPFSRVKLPTLEADHSHYPVLKLRMSGALLPIPHIHSWLSA